MTRWMHISLVAAVLLLGYVMVATDREDRAILNGGDQEKWRQQIEALGADEAYRFFSEEASKMTYADAHTNAHLIGDVLYDKHGSDAIVHCTADFGYGCIHQIAARVYDETGMTGMKGLTEKCRVKGDEFRDACLHGIGHAIMFENGENLTASLNACAEIEQGGPNCFNGVFMEYDFHTMENPGIRAYPASDFEEPCATKSIAEAKPVCYYVLPSRWNTALGTTSPEMRFAQLGTQCAIIDEEYTVSCYLGIGSLINAESDSRPESEAWCGLMPSGLAEAACLSELR
jgi:hypothetical protein